MLLQKHYGGRRDVPSRLLLEPFLSREEAQLLLERSHAEPTDSGEFLDLLTPKAQVQQQPPDPNAEPLHPAHFSVCIEAAVEELETRLVPHYVALPLLSATAHHADPCTREHLLQFMDGVFGNALARFTALHTHPTAGSPRVRASGALTAALRLLALVGQCGATAPALGALHKTTPGLLLPPVDSKATLSHIRGLCCGGSAALVAWCTALYYGATSPSADPKQAALALCSALCDRRPLRFAQCPTVRPRTIIALTVAFLLAEVDPARTHRIREHFPALIPAVDFAAAASSSLTSSVGPRIVATVKAELGHDRRDGLFAALLRAHGAEDWHCLLDVLLQQPEPQRWCACEGRRVFE